MIIFATYKKYKIMNIKKPFVGIIAFMIVLITMPLGHALMIVMENIFGHSHIYLAAMILGFFGLILLIWGMIVKKQLGATILGLFSGLFVWTGWVEFAFVYFANRFKVAPLMEAGEVITKPEYLIMPSSIGFWAIFILYYFFGTKTGCTFFTWFQKRLGIVNPKQLQPAVRNVAITTFMELNMILWTFYLLLLFLYDKQFIGDDSIVMHIVAYSSLLWSLYLFMKLIKKTQMSYAIRYAIPTVIIFWNFVEILGRWGLFKEIWVHPFEYALEMILFILVIIVLLVIVFLEQKKAKRV